MTVHYRVVNALKELKITDQCLLALKIQCLSETEEIFEIKP